MAGRPGRAGRRQLLLGVLLACWAPAARAMPPVPLLDELDVLELFGLRGAQPPPPRPGELMYFALPAFGVNPSVGTAFGVAGTAAIALGPVESTIVSSASASVMVTTKKQLMSSLKSTLVTAENRWELLGDVRYYRFSQDTFGLGTGPRVDGSFILNGMQTSLPDGAQPMAFDYVKVHETVLRQLRPGSYAGLGYHLDVHWDVEDEAPVEGEISSHRAYSLYQGFDPSRYRLGGVSLDALHETRDHTLDPYRGTYALVSWRLNPTWLGSTRPSTLLYAEVRSYLSLSPTRARHLLAFWAYGHLVTSGKVPYLDLPAVGYDTRDRSGRGYPQGRFRGTALVYGEIEYRFPITRRGLVAGVLFLNATTAARPPVSVPEAGVDDPGITLFDAVEPAGGAGLRIRFDSRARMNLVVDYAVGRGGSNGLYVSVGETF